MTASINITIISEEKPCPRPFSIGWVGGQLHAIGAAAKDDYQANPFDRSF